MNVTNAGAKTRAPLNLQRPVKQSLNPANFKNEGESSATTQDEDDWLLADTPPTPPSVTSEEQRQLSATLTVDQLFHAVKLRISCPPRWRKLFLAAGRRYELRLHRLQEAMFIGCAVDDLNVLRELKEVIPEQLWSWWAYELGLYQRAARRCRPEMLSILPVIQGSAYPPQAEIAEIKRTMNYQPSETSQEGIARRQHGEMIIEAVQGVFEGELSQFDMDALKSALNHPLGNSLRNPAFPQLVPAVNHGIGKDYFMGWRAMHFVSASPFASNAVDAAEMLIEVKADLTLKDASGGTVLHAAALMGHMAIVNLLLENGAPLEEEDLSGSTALMVAARNRKVRIVKAIINWTVPPERLEMLQEAEKFDNKFNILKNLELLRVVGANDRTAVTQLVTVGDGVGTNLADINFQDAQGRQAAHIAITCIGEEEETCAMLRTLYLLKGQINGQDFLGNTPLHLAARIGRSEAAKTLLALKAHPGLKDKKGRTPLMVAAASSLDDVRAPPPYSGKLVNSGIAWGVTDTVLQWDGLGGPPPELPLRPPGPPEPKPEEQQRRKKFAEMAAEQDQAAKMSVYGSSALDKVKSRADIFASLGFDDQHIFGVDGLVNQGDRLRLHEQILLPAGDRTHGIEALMMKEGDAQKLKPVEKRCRALWNVMIAPLLMLAHQNRLENRQPDLLKYLLHCLLGHRGMVFGVLASVSPTKRTATLPAWEEVAKALESGSLSERLENLRLLGFRGPKPRKTCWAGSVWVKDEYPRNPDSAPWKAFEYVDREDADVLGQGKPGMKNEAFRWNRLWCLESNIQVDSKEREWESGFKKRAEQFIWEESPGFKWDGFGGKKSPTPSIHDKLQLTNRLFVDEALAQCVPMTSRLKLVGEKILCPLLIFCAESLKKTSVGAWLTGNDPEEVDAAEKLAVHRDMLRYVASQVACGGAEDKVWQKPFLKVWEETKEKVAVALLTKQSEDLMQLTELVEEVRWQANESQGIRRSAFEPKDAPQDQAELLPEDEIRWFKRRQSTQAYVQLRLCGAIGCAKDFLAMAASISRTQPRNFAPAFWMASYGLLLWGRARQLRPSLEIALRKRLIRAKFPEEEEEEESESEDDDDDLSDLEEDEGDMEEKEKPVPQFAIYGPHLIPLAEVLRLDWSKGPAGAPSQRVSVKEGEEPLPTGPVNMLRTEIVCKNVESLLAAYDVLTEDPDEDDIPAKSKETINLEEVSPDGEEEGDEEEDDPTSEVEEGEGGEDGQDDEFEDDVFLPEEAEGSAPSELSLFSRAELHVQRRAPFGLPAKLRLVKVFNGFHPDNATSIFPQAAGVLLLMHVSARKSKTAHKGHGEKESDWSEPLVDPSDLVQQLVEVELLLDSTVEARWLTNFTKLDPPWLEQRREQQKQLLMEQTLAAFRRKSMQEERRNSQLGHSLSAAALAASPKKANY